jgi:hypothetical protein
MYFIIKSNKLHKKYDVINEGKRILSFGDNRYSDYTKHKDPIRKELYIGRHEKREDWEDLNKAGTWSRYILWNKPTLKASIKDMEKLFNIRIVFLE